jgi:hypothetical protein
MNVDRFDHPSWLTAAATGVAYGLLLLGVFALLFLVPYGAFRLLG